MPHHISYSITLFLLFSLRFTIVWYVSFLAFCYSTKLVHTHPTTATPKFRQPSILMHVALAVCVILLCGLAVCMPTQ